MTMPDEMTISDLAAVMVQQLEAAGWIAELEPDYPDDYKEYYVSRSVISGDVFPCFHLLLLTLDNNPRNFDIRFIFYANPTQIKPNKRAFARFLRTEHVPKLQERADALLRLCNATTRQEEITIDSRPKHRLKFDDGPAVAPAYAIQMHYWKYPRLLTP